MYECAGTEPQAAAWHSTAVPQPWATPESGQNCQSGTGMAAEGSSRDALPVESLETTLPLRDTVWSYFFVESLYLSART